jgi:undecaprenyl-phosphate glucose phosphotransferase
MVRPPIKTVGPGSHAGPGAVSSTRDRRRFMDVLDKTSARPAIPGVSRIVLVGARRDARRLIRTLAKRPWSGLPIVGFVDSRHSRPSGLRSHSRHLALHPQTDPVPILGGIERLDELIDRARATDIVVAVSGSRPPRMGPELSQLGNADVAVHWVSVDSVRLDLSVLSGSRKSGSTEWHVHSPNKPGPIKQRLRPRLPRAGSVWDRLRWSRALKRVIDTMVAVFALIVLAPLLALVAVAILVTTGRPIFYSQERVGQGGRLFRIIKFRSMRTDAEIETGPIWASNHDSRCTRIGDWLRHTNIDELPQLLNVVKGDMGLVGPRPERPNFVADFRHTVPDYDLRHAVPGGMTGWAQVHGWRGKTSLRKRIQYDLDYIERWSIALDLRILLMTVQHVFWGKTSWNESKRTERKAG